MLAGVSSGGFQIPSFPKKVHPNRVVNLIDGQPSIRTMGQTGGDSVLFFQTTTIVFRGR